MSAIRSHSQSLAKAVSWRLVGSVDTFVVAFVLTGHPGAAGAIASTEVLTKTVLYYLHERVWLIRQWGGRKVPDDQESHD